LATARASISVLAILSSSVKLDWWMLRTSLEYMRETRDHKQLDVISGGKVTPKKSICSICSVDT